MSVTLIAGLGNPGREYAATRHNVGFLVLDALAAAEKLSWRHERRFESDVARWTSRPDVVRLLVKPQTFMNDSGRALRRLVDFHKVPLESVIVIYDDLNIDLGFVKVSVRGSAGGHNGIASVLSRVGAGFVRFRVGIGGTRPPGMDIKDYVLSPFSTSEQNLIDQKLTSFVDGLRLLLDGGTDRAMNTLNRRDRNEPEQA